MGTACIAVGCSGDDAEPSSATAETSGSLGLALAVGTAKLSSFSYVVTGPGGFSRTGSVDVANSGTLSVLIGNLPVAAGFSVSVSAHASDSTSCQGSAGFSVAARATTKVVVHLQCREPAKTGSVDLEGDLAICPQIDGISASPAETALATPIALSADAHDSDHGPTALSYLWSTSSGAVANGTSSTPTFTCGAAGPATLTLVVSDGNCTDTLEATVVCRAPTDPVAVVAASVETTPVPDSVDAADDPAVWVHPTAPASSLIIGTDKQAGGGLGVYGLDGAQLQYLPFGKLNNVDVRDGFSLGGASVPLVTAGNRSDATIAIFALDPATRRLSDVAARKITTLPTYGSCMYKSPVSGKFYYFVDAKDGRIEQWELFESAGKVDAKKVRDLRQLSSQPEACAVDDEARALFVGEEATGVWKLDAEPDVLSGPGYEGVLIASTEPGGHLVRDVEGVAIAKTSASSGYIFVSNQGESTYAVFTREAPHSYVKTFRVARGSACVDAVTGSDGIEATAANLGPAFPHGVFVTQDDSNDGLNQNFKLVPLDHILGTPPAVDDSACSAGGGDGSGGSNGAGGTSAGGSGGSGGYGEPFCTSYCNKRASCYATGTFSEGDCVFKQPKNAFTVEDCQAGCAASATPGAAAKASLPAGFESLSCVDFDASI
jgi:3-phytase